MEPNLHPRAFCALCGTDLSGIGRCPRCTGLSGGGAWLFWALAVGAVAVAALATGWLLLHGTRLLG